MNIWLSAFCVSFVINIVSALYVRWLFLQIKEMNDQVEIVSGSIQLFSSHLKQIHDMEIFYGDTTLQGLLQHANEIVSLIDDVDFIIYENSDSESLEQVDEEG